MILSFTSAHPLGHPAACFLIKDNELANELFVGFSSSISCEPSALLAPALSTSVTSEVPPLSTGEPSALPPLGAPPTLPVQGLSVGLLSELQTSPHKDLIDSPYASQLPLPHCLQQTDRSCLC